MGQAIVRRLAERPDLCLVGIWARDTDLDALVSAADVVIDFSLPTGTEKVLQAVMRHAKPLVCGVSGLSDAQMQQLDAAAAKVPLVYDRNMSLGIAVLERAVRDAAASLGPEFDVLIEETHHVHKKDAPSGTALQLGEAVVQAQSGREIKDREIKFAEIEYKVERRGEVPGDHKVIMTSPFERLGFSHSVTSRDVFADGALHAAGWLLGQTTGRYSMRDVLLTDPPAG
jgi:4-hydroxy-tetrahydrodipicolinate reductase